MNTDRSAQVPRDVLEVVGISRDHKIPAGKGSRDHRWVDNVASGRSRTRGSSRAGARLVVIGVGMKLVAGAWLMCLVPVLLSVLDNFVIVPFEERSMEDTFGDAYRTYRARVRRRI